MLRINAASMRKQYAAFIRERRLIIFLLVSAAFVRGRRLLEGGVYASDYGIRTNLYIRFSHEWATRKLNDGLTGERHLLLRLRHQRPI